MSGWGGDDEPPSDDARRLFANARALYDRIGEIVSNGSLQVTPDLVCEFHSIATAGEPDPRKPPGKVRREDVVIGRVVVLYEPPPWQDVPRLLEEACREINSKMASGAILHAAAYALWRINWIHPFGDGNGKTSRAVMYVILCAGFGRMIPGETSLPDLIARNPYDYWDALKAADKAWKRGVLDVTAAEHLISELMEDSLFPIYKMAWQRAKDEGAIVLFDGLTEDFTAYFSPPRGSPPSPPTIHIIRPYYEESEEPTRTRIAGAPLPPPDIMTELIALAHSYGQFRLWKDRMPRPEWEAYDAVVAKWDAANAATRERCGDDVTRDEFNDQLRTAVWNALTDGDRARVMEHEERSWDAARELLDELEFDERDTFEERRRFGLHYHRYRLGIEGLWPGDT